MATRRSMQSKSTDCYGLPTTDSRLSLAAGGDREVNRPGGIGGNERSQLADGSRCDLLSQPAGGFPPRGGNSTRYAAATRARERIIAFAGAPVSTRMKAPSRVLNRKLASTRAPSSAAHDA